MDIDKYSDCNKCKTCHDSDDSDCLCPSSDCNSCTDKKKCKNQDQNITQCQGSQTQDLGDLEQLQGPQSQTQGDLTETQGDQASSQGDQSQLQGDLEENQGDQSQVQGDLTETQGDQASSQGDQSQLQGDLEENQGDQAQVQGDLTETQGDQASSQGDQSQTQGSLTETLGDMAQYQGGETQGDQTQSITGHGGQTQGDQILLSTPTISTPVTVSGLNLNLNVNCCGENKKSENCCNKDCIKEITMLLRLIESLTLSITDPNNSGINFYALGLETLPTTANLSNITECSFTIAPISGENDITILTNNLEAISIDSSATTPSLFSELLTYLQSLPANFYYAENLCNECLLALENQLYSYYLSRQEIRINVQLTSFEGYIYMINNGIVYLVDDLNLPTVIYAIPICKILSYQPQ